LFLATSHFVFLQIFYISSNFPAGIYLFIATVTFWLGLKEQNKAWFFFSILAVVGYSLSRSEGLAIAALFLTIVLSVESLSFRERLYIVLPYASFMIAWNLWLARSFSEVSPGIQWFLSARNIWLMILPLFFLSALTALSSFAWVERITRKLHFLAFSGLLLILGISIFKAAQIIYTQFSGLVFNLLNTEDLWGRTWWFVVILLVPLPWLPKIPKERFFLPFFFAYTSIYIIISWLTDNLSFGREGWSSTSSRVMSSILPLILFYLAVKYQRLLQMASYPSSSIKVQNDKVTG